MEMLADRGYIIPHKKLAQTFEEFKEGLGDDRFLTMSATKDDDSHDKRILVFFPEEEKLSQDHIKNYITKLHDNDILHCILVVKGKITPSAEKMIREFESSLTIEVFNEKEMYVNITRHEYVPKHVLLSNDEKKELLKRYKIKDFQLPKILKGDAIARYLGLKRSNVVKIIRSSETAGKYITYRLCI
eukprot:CAMPEP_0197009428 /NCGR_PEP_ID=MMETSP1380-20130617/50069_1 /TAXON_ID=5936 /ORGANISM="Euplotes crassus, Strain CT5" /LENGTH=186 /DNA_ID=CAMNT_0042430669 /DNA_START=45 /DNA_END=605 /DNA_ORIENTATION=-